MMFEGDRYQQEVRLPLHLQSQSSHRKLCYAPFAILKACHFAISSPHFASPPYPELQ